MPIHNRGGGGSGGLASELANISMYTHAHSQTVVCASHREQSPNPWIEQRGGGSGSLASELANISMYTHAHLQTVVCTQHPR